MEENNLKEFDSKRKNLLTEKRKKELIEKNSSNNIENVRVIEESTESLKLKNEMKQSNLNLLESEINHDKNSINLINNNDNNENKKLEYLKNYFQENNNKKRFSNKFKSLGYFYIKNNKKENDSEEKIVYLIFHRRMIIDENNIIDNFFFQDNTEFVDLKIKEIKDINRKQKILAKMSHEFKTPLNSIIGLISIIMEQEEINLSLETKENLKTIESLSNYLVFLLPDIIAQINSREINNFSINLSLINYKETMNFCFNIMESLVICNKRKRENINMIFKCDENVDYVKTEIDEIRLKQIILNFISNSVKFTDKGRIKLKCKLKTFENHKKFVVISVSDTGIGIKEEDKKKLFTEYMQLENGLKENNKLGSGLGLSICKNIARKLNIELGMKSEEEKGSKFYIKIPVMEKDIIPKKQEKISNEEKFALIPIQKKYSIESKNSSKSNSKKLEIELIPNSEMQPSVMKNYDDDSIASSSPSLSKEINIKIGNQ